MSLAENRPYFLLVPESPDKKAGLFDVAYAPLFQDLADQDVLDSLLFLYTREENKGFTVNLLTKKLHLQPDKAAAVVETIKRYGMIHTTSVELDDASQETTPAPQPALAALLLFAMISSNASSLLLLFRQPDRALSGVAPTATRPAAE